MPNNRPRLEDLRPPLFYVAKKFEKEAQKFFDLYEMEEYIPCPPIPYGSLKLKRERTCRFCGNRYPEVTFKFKAHLIPELLGNRYLMSDFECDNCNTASSKYENDLANFLAVARTMNVVKGKKDVPTYKSPDSSLILTGNKNDSMVLIARSNAADKSITYDPVQSNIVINFTCNPYIPLNVYKAILKIALSVLPQKHVEKYTSAFKYVISSELDTYLLGSKVVSMTVMPMSYIAKFPIGMIFKKREPEATVFTHFFCLYFQNFIFQTVIPLNSDDIHLYDQRQISLPICPLLCPTAESANQVNEFEISSYPFDLSSSELKRDDARSMSMPVDETRIREIRDKLLKERNVDFNLGNIVEIELFRDFS